MRPKKWLSYVSAEPGELKNVYPVSRQEDSVIETDYMNFAVKNICTALSSFPLPPDRENSPPYPSDPLSAYFLMIPTSLYAKIQKMDALSVQF